MTTIPASICIGHRRREERENIKAHFPSIRTREMAGLNHAPMPFTFGILGNIISSLVYLAPIPTFLRIYRRRSVEGFHSFPYIVALFSAMLWLFYAFQKVDDYLLMSINSIGCFIESCYILMFLIFAQRRSKLCTVLLLLIMNVGMFGSMVLFTTLFSKDSRRLHIVGWICLVSSVAVFASPLSIIKRVICTKSVEFMLFHLSFFLTLSAIAWFFYGYLSHDYFVAFPNTVRFALGLGQMVLYACYRRRTPAAAMPASRDAEIMRRSCVVTGGPQVHPEAIGGGKLPVCLSTERIVNPNVDVNVIDV